MVKKISILCFYSLHKMLQKLIDIYHNLYFLFKSFKDILFMFDDYLATLTSTSIKTLHKLTASIIELFPTFTESMIPAENMSTIFSELIS